MAGPEREDLYRVAYEEAVRALAEQRVLIESLRSRAGLLLSAAAVSASFLGAQARGGPLSWFALLAFSGSASACLAVLWPRGWEEAIDVSLLIDDHLESTDPPPFGRLLEGLALNLSRGYRRNRPGIERLGSLLQLAGGLLSLEILLGIAAVAFRT